uniref:Uncharacterized protein n=1 Tax=Arundo donax TaxID=35708 RepID=A0A0A9EMQ9_ARUDO
MLLLAHPWKIVVHIVLSSVVEYEIKLINKKTLTCVRNSGADF